jgi:hypothetical protein
LPIELEVLDIMAELGEALLEAIAEIGDPIRYVRIWR